MLAASMPAAFFEACFLLLIRCLLDAGCFNACCLLLIRWPLPSAAMDVLFPAAASAAPAPPPLSSSSSSWMGVARFFFFPFSSLFCNGQQITVSVHIGHYRYAAANTPRYSSERRYFAFNVAPMAAMLRGNRYFHPWLQFALPGS